MNRSHLLVLLWIASNGCGGRAQTIADEPNPEPTGRTSTGGSSEGGAGAVAGDTSSHSGAVSGGTSSSAGGATAAALQSTLQCLNSLNTGVGLSSCDYACSALNDCCSGGIYCDDSGQWLDPPAACGVPSLTHCMVSAPDATLSGATPLGPVSLSYAWAEETTGFSTQLVLFFTGSPTAQRCEPTSLGFNVATVAQAGAAYIGTSESVALLHVAGKVAYGAATAQIDSKDAAGTHGTLVIDGPGWDFRGEFTAPDCTELDYHDNGK